MNIQQPVIIFSVTQPNIDPTLANASVLKKLRAEKVDGKKIGFKQVQGVFNGAKEESFVISAEHEVLAQAYCIAYNQECYLYLHNDRHAELRNPHGKLISSLGKFKAVTKEIATVQDHTYDASLDTYFIIEK